MSKYITGLGIYVMLFSEELQMLERYQLIHPHCLPGSSGSFSIVSGKTGERGEVGDSPMSQGELLVWDVERRGPAWCPRETWNKEPWVGVCGQMLALLFGI